MNVFTKFFTVFLCFALSFGVVFGSDISDPRVERAYNNLILKLDRQMSSAEQIIFLEKLGNKIDIIFNTKTLSDKNTLLISDIDKLNNEKLFSLYFNTTKSETLSAISEYSLSKSFVHISQNPENIFLENWVWYFYDFDTTLFFDTNNISLASLRHNDINPDTDVLILREWGTVGFANTYKKVKLITDSITFGMPDKYDFLKEIRNDQQHIYISNTDQLFLQLKNESQKLTTSTKTDEKVKSVYSWMLENLQYTINFDINDRRIFSGIQTYNNKDGVCEWYTKVMMYMLKFLWVRNSEVIRWDVIDAPDFPNIGHAWVRVWNNFYDPTFDDPVANTQTRQFEDYRYYKLPKDLMYTNRFDFWKTPEALESTNLGFRKNLVSQKLFGLIGKYNSDDYIILQWSEFRNKLNIHPSDDITIDDIKKSIGYIEVAADFSTILDGKKIYVSKFQYYTLSNGNVESILNQLEYNLEWFYLMKFYPDWSSRNFEYRLAYDVAFR